MLKIVYLLEILIVYDIANPMMNSVIDISNVAYISMLVSDVICIMVVVDGM